MIHLLTLALSTLVPGQQSAPSIGAPKIFRSAEGKYALREDREGENVNSSCRYRFVVNGKVKWDTRLPYVVVEAYINAKGSFVGYGIQAFKNAPAQFIFVAGNPASDKLKIIETHTMQGSHQVQGAVFPTVEGSFYSADVDEAVFRIWNPDEPRSAEEWWTYAVSAGLNVTKLRPGMLMGKEASAETYPIEAKPIPGTPLTLISWHTPQKDRATLTLVDITRKPVWRIDVPGISANGNPILSIGDRRFTLRFSEKNERVLFGLTPGNMNWNVMELAHRPLQPSDRPNAQ